MVAFRRSEFAINCCAACLNWGGGCSILAGNSKLQLTNVTFFSFTGCSVKMTCEFTTEAFWRDPPSRITVTLENALEPPMVLLLSRIVVLPGCATLPAVAKRMNCISVGQ